ncbi:hypothetical protein [Bdellovibrio bacteriovorus]|uniref:hypothetical protein n=1 Tax=Bdellovibrio bacteriovorus TaxID=959 RepID=UPI003D007894
MALVNSINVSGFAFHGLWRNSSGEGIVSIARGSALDVYPTRSIELRRYLRQKAYLIDGENERSRILNDNALDSIIGTIDALCDLSDNEVNLSVRVATGAGGEILVDGISNIYSITADGWNITSIERPIFKRSSGMKPLPEPVPGGDIHKVFEYLNIKDKSDRLLFLTYLVSSFVADIPHPFGNFFGSQGAAKTTAMKVFTAIVDPNTVTDIHSASENDFQIAASQRWVVCLDNVPDFTRKFSDYICKVVTGASFIKRRLYTDDSMMAERFLRVVVANGITVPAQRADLLDRCLLFQLERIERHLRKDEKTLFADFETDRAQILGGCFDALSKAMALLPTIEGSFNTRMADYGKWGCAIALALGYCRSDFEDALEKNNQRLNEESLDASPIATVLDYIFLKAGSSGFRGSASDLLSGIRSCAESAGIEPRYLPSSPHAMGKKLVEIKANLQSSQYFIEFVRGKERIWTICSPPSYAKDRSKYLNNSLSSISSGVTRAFSYNDKMTDL